MLSTIIFDLRPKHYNLMSCHPNAQQSNLFHSLERNQICCKYFEGAASALSLYFQQFTYQKDSTLFVSDLADHLLIAKNLGFFCVGYDTGAKFLPVDYCFQDPSSLDSSYFIKILCRYKKEPISILTTRHLQIREFAPKNLSNLYDIYQEPEIRVFLSEGKECYETFYEKYVSYISKIYPFYDFGMWGIFTKDTDSLIGACGFQLLSIDQRDEIAIGYLLSSKFQNQGLGKEMVKAVLQYGHQEFAFSRIVAQIHPENIASIALAKSCGFHYEKICETKDGNTLLFVYDFSCQKKKPAPSPKAKMG